LMRFSSSPAAFRAARAMLFGVTDYAFFVNVRPAVNVARGVHFLDSQSLKPNPVIDYNLDHGVTLSSSQTE
jgi:hypothetical protein